MFIFPRGSTLRTRGFAAAELILTVTTATIVAGTAFTSLAVYLSVNGEKTQVSSPNGPAAVLPARELTLDAVLFHLEFQRLAHEADLCHVIGGFRCVPGSEEPAGFVFNPSLESGGLRALDILDTFAHAPDRALSSHVVTRALRTAEPSAFEAVSAESLPYQQREFTVLTARSDRTVTSVTRLSVFPEENWIVLDASLFLPEGTGWARSLAYRCALSRDAFDVHGPNLTIGAEHHWVRHDRLDPVGSPEADNSLWNRYEEGFCRVVFPDPSWDPDPHPGGTAVPSKFTYLLPVAK